MACKNQTAVRYRLEIIQKGTGTTRWEHCKFGRDVWAYTSTVLSVMEWRQPSKLPTTSSGDICMPACKLHKHQRVSSGLCHLRKRVVWTRCGSMKSMRRYAAENRWRKRQQKLKNDLWKSTKRNAGAMISTRQCFMKIVFGIGGRMAYDSIEQELSNTIHPRG